MNKIKKVLLLTLIISVISNLNAHFLWVNSFESFSHKPGHITVGLGWGHAIPIDDILNSPNGRVIVDSFSITSPDQQVIKLKIPPSQLQDPIKKSTNFNIYEADVGLQKIALKKESKQGVYKIEATTKPTFYTEYIDQKNRKRLKLTTIDKVKNPKEILMSVKYQATARSYLTLNKWTEQKPNNKGLEIIPKTDLSNIKVGDIIEFEVFFYGKPLHVSPASMEFITAQSKGFGQEDQYWMFSYIQKGKAKIKVHSTGQWIVSSFHTENVKSTSVLKDLYKKANQVVYGSTLTFHVKEK